jgi:tripartite-type tricarboxylate transporter receptor subunit TctC
MIRQQKKEDRVFGVLLLCVVVAFSTGGWREVSAEEVSFKGDTVRVYVGFGPGSSNDTYLRQFAPYLQRHLPGNPTVIVENKEGGGGVLMGNYFYNTVKPDGKSAGFLAVAVMNMWLGHPNVKFDITKMPLLGVFGVNVVTVVHESSGIKTAKDLLSLKKTVYIGASSRTSPNYIGDVALLEIFGVPYKGLTGISDSGRAFQGMRSGELTLYSVASDRYLVLRDSLAKDGVYAICQRGILEPDGSVTNQKELGVPTLDEIIRQYKPEAVGTPIFKALIASQGVYAGAKPYFLPPGTPQKYVEAWSKSLAEANRNQEYVALVKKQTGEVMEWIGPEKGRRLLNTITANLDDKEIAATIKAISEKK